MGPGACLAVHGRENVRRRERRGEREGHCQGEGTQATSKGEKAAPGVVLGSTFLNVYFMPESGEAEDLF